MDGYKEYTQQDYWDMLPLSKEQREKIIKDFIETDQYDKIEVHDSDDEYEGDLTEKYKKLAEEKKLK